MTSRDLISEGLKYLTEIFKRPYPFKKVFIDIEGREGMAVFQAYTDQDKLLRIDFASSSAPYVYELDFTINYSFGRTGFGDQYRILSTVLKALEMILDKHKDDIKAVKFSAEKEYDVETDMTNTSRSRLYERIINRFARREGFSMQKREYYMNTEFTLTNKDFAK